MEADQAGDQGAGGDAERQAALIGRRIVRAMLSVWDRLIDALIESGLGILDWITPHVETPVDRAIREEGERLRRAFPWLDERRR